MLKFYNLEAWPRVFCCNSVGHFSMQTAIADQAGQMLSFIVHSVKLKRIFSAF